MFLYIKYVCRKFFCRIQILHNSYTNPMNQRRPKDAGEIIRGRPTYACIHVKRVFRRSPLNLCGCLVSHICPQIRRFNFSKCHYGHSRRHSTTFSFTSYRNLNGDMWNDVGSGIARLSLLILMLARGCPLRARLVACTLFWALWAQTLAGLGRIKRAKTSVDISFGGLGRSQRAKRPMLIGCSMFPSLCEQSTTPAICLPSEGHSH
jgi:hypothetical protein